MRIRRMATIDDLNKELWLRMRQSKSLYWETKNGEKIPIKDMDTQHLINTIRMLAKQEEKANELSELQEEFEAYLWEKL